MPLPSVSILGCGWLGLPLARALVMQGYRVKGSTTTLEKVPVLKEAGIFAFYLQVDERVKWEGAADFFASDIVVITLPFRRDFADPRDYQKQIQAIASECVQIGKVQTVIFTSSTSVYPDNTVKATEDFIFPLDHGRVRAGVMSENKIALRSEILRDIENGLMANKNFAATIVRFAGLYGPDRKIGAFLAGQRELSGADRYVNLIHQDDAVGIMVAIIAQDVQREIFNGCSDQHPTRKELYTAAARRMGLAAPQFREERKTVSKIVANDKVKKILGYRFQHPDPLRDME